MSAAVPTTILVVDDDRAIRTLVQGLLEREGYKTLVADSAEEALALFPEHQESVALLVTDMVMAGIQGTELARQLQRIKPNLPVLVVSACRGQFDEALEGFPCLSKPFTIRELVGRVGELLPQRKGTAREKVGKERKLKSG